MTCANDSDVVDMLSQKAMSSSGETATLLRDSFCTIVNAPNQVMKWDLEKEDGDAASTLEPLLASSR